MEDRNKAESLMWSPSPPKPAVIARRLRNAASMQAARSRETPEAYAIRKEQNAARMEVLRASEPEGRAAERRARNAAAMQASRARETPEQADSRRAQNAARMVALRANESPEQRASRRALNAKRMQAARAKEALQETESSVGINLLLEDDVMRKAVLATHRQPLKKRKDRDRVVIMDLDKQDKQEHVTNLAVITPLPKGSVLENREGTNKFSFHVN